MIQVTGEMVSALVGVTTLLLTLIGGISAMVNLKFRVSSIEADMNQIKDDMKQADLETKRNYERLLEKFDKLTDEINKLTLSLGKLEIKQDMM